jgi:hypothetical protein
MHVRDHRFSVRDRRLGIGNHRLSICDRNLGIHNSYVCIDRKLGLKEIPKFKDSQQKPIKRTLKM